jgi:cytoskeletal protein RodZ
MSSRLHVAKRRTKSGPPVFPKAGKEPEALVFSPEGTAAALPRPVPPRPVFDPMYSVGHQLMKARQARGLSIEDVAFETRIPHQRLRELENDDLSNFANLTYAKGFLKLYSRFLDLDLSDYLDEFDTSAIADVTGHEYVHTASAVRSLSAPAIAQDEPRYRPAGGLLGLAALVTIAGIGLVWWKSGSSSQEESPNPAKVAQSPAAPPKATPVEEPEAEAPTPARTAPITASVTLPGTNPPPAPLERIAPALPVDEPFATPAPTTAEAASEPGTDRIRRATIVE